MSKTYRYSYEDEDFGFQNHRIPRRDLNKARRHQAAKLIRLPIPVNLQIIPTDAPWEGEVVPTLERKPSPTVERLAHHSSLDFVIRARRLEAIQEMSEQIIQQSLD